MAFDLSALRNQALAHIEALLTLNNVEWKKISDHEIDFKNPNREDTNFGSARFNTLKNLGMDFALPELDFSEFGPGFTKDDFLVPNEKRKPFDVIGLFQVIYNYDTYLEAASRVKTDLMKLYHLGQEQDVDQATKFREELLSKNRVYTAKRIIKTWEYCSKVRGTVGENYLKQRCIYETVDEPNMKFHPRIKNNELKKFLPAIIFKVSKSIDAPVDAIHRIYLTEEGYKYKELESPKMALGAVKGLGIWYGKPGPTLFVAEGPENALSLLALNGNNTFVVSTISAANFSNLTIPKEVTHVRLFPDAGRAGNDARDKAAKEYLSQGKTVTLQEPHKDGDWNEFLIKRRGVDGQG